MYLSTYIVYVKNASMPKVLQRNMEWRSCLIDHWQLKKWF